MAVIAGTMIAAVGMQAVGMIADFVGSSKAASAAKKAAMKAKLAEAKLTKERIRQINKEEEVLRGQTVAATAAGGVKVNSETSLLVYAEQAREFEHERKITAQVGASRAAAALQKGKDVGNAYKYQAYGNLAKGASEVFSMAAQAGMFSKGTSAPGGG